MTFRGNPFLNSRNPTPSKAEKKRVREETFDNTLNYIHKHGYKKWEKKYDEVNLPTKEYLENLVSGKYRTKKEEYYIKHNRYITKNGKRIRIG